MTQKSRKGGEHNGAHCSFCGAPANEVALMFNGADGSSICASCIEHGYELLVEHDIIAQEGGKKSKGICNSMKLRVTLRNSHIDTVYIPFIVTETKTKSFTYKAAQESAQSCISALEIIADLNDTRKEATNVPVVNMNVSAADEILKFKQLLDAGIITQEEFESKKKQILNL